MREEPKNQLIRIRMNKAIPGFPAGRTTTVVADPEGTPLDEFWRRRLEDAKIDNCCEVVVLEPELELEASGDEEEPSQGPDGSEES
jgi:hypothetical protein